jgi:hypothetical protein
MDDEKFASLLVNAVNGLPDDDRNEVLIELVQRGLGSSGSSGSSGAGGAGGAGSAGGGRSRMGPRASFVDALSAGIPAAGERRNVLVRFEAAQHEQLRAWCQANDIAMATVLRGLVDRFLRAQADAVGAAGEGAGAAGEGAA